MTQKKWSTCLWCDWGVEKLLFWHEFVKTKPLFLHLRRPKCHQWFNFAIKHGWDFPELNLKIYESFHRRIIELNGGLDEESSICLYMGNFPAKTSLHWKVLTAFVTPNILAPCIADWRYLVLTACANHETKLSIYIFGSILKLSDIETSAQMCRQCVSFFASVWMLIDPAFRSGSTEQLQDLWPTLDNAGDKPKSGSPAHWNKGDGWFDKTSKNIKKSS